MAPTPETATFRVVFRYSSVSVGHAAHFYLKCTNSGDASGYDALVQGTFTPAGVSDLIDPFFTVMAPYYNPSNSSFDSMTLEEKVSGAWIPLWAGGTSVVPTASGPNAIAMGECIAGKTTDNKHLKFYHYEGVFGMPQKITARSLLNAAGQALVDYFFGTGTTPLNTDAWAWRCNKGETYAERWLSVVVDSNEKLRRVRHIK